MLTAITFGHSRFESPAVQVTPDSEVQFALLLSLVAAPAEGVARDDLVKRLWPEPPIEDARHSLRQALYRLRKLGIQVTLDAGFVRLDEPDARVDLRDLLRGGLPHERLLALAAHPFLPGVHATIGEGYAAWLDALRERVAAHLRRALAAEIDGARNAGRFRDMESAARALLALDPLNERATLAVAEALALDGSKVSALRVLEAYEDEVGAVDANLQLPARVLRRRVSESLPQAPAHPRHELPLVARAREFATLREWWRVTRTGIPQLAFITGEAGIGKSRLSAEFLRLAALEGASVATYEASTGDSLTPLGALVALAERLLAMPGALGCDAAQLDYLKALGTPVAEDESTADGPFADIRYAQLVLAFAEVLGATAEEAPVLLRIDEADRLHPTVWRILVDVTERIEHHAVLVLLVSRRLPAWYGEGGGRASERLARDLRLEPLTDAEADEFLARWGERSGRPLAETRAERCREVARGNPFYLGEFAAHWGDSTAPAEVPPSIRDLITAQYRFLSPPARRALAAIVALEARATTARLHAALEVPAAELMTALDELADAGLVSVDGEYLACRHPLIAEVAGELIPAPVRVLSYSRAAAVLEADAEATDSVELLGDCVAHWERAGDRGRAFHASMRLGERLLRLGMGEEAERAGLTALQNATTPRQTAAALSARMAAAHSAAKWDVVCEVFAAYKQSLHEAPNAGHERDRRFLMYVESTLWNTGQLDDLSQALAIAEDPSVDVDLRTEAALLCAFFADNYYRADLIARACQAPGIDLSTPPASPAAQTLALIFHCALGDPAIATSLAHTLAKTSRSNTDAGLRLQGMRRAAVAHIRIGNISLADRLICDVLSEARMLRLERHEHSTLELQFDCHMATGRFGEASQCLENLTRLARHNPMLRLAIDCARVRLAWGTRDASILADIGDDAFSGITSPITHLENNLIANRIAIALLSGRVLSDSRSVENLRAIHLKGRHMGRQDYQASVLFTALEATGDRQASQLKQEYLSAHRRESFGFGDAPFGLS